MHGFDWTFPYPSQRMPVLSRQAVATSQPLAAQVGLSVMQRGGNAADAAVATGTVWENGGVRHGAPTSSETALMSLASFWGCGHAQVGGREGRLGLDG